jgi:hypothetical protein
MTLELEGGENLSVDFFSTKIQNIVNNNHKIDTKKKLRYYPTYKPKRINFACPYCGDSQKVNTKYRGNVWLNSMMYTCFNCGTKKSFPSFCSDFNENIDLEDKIKIYNYLDDISYSNDDFSVKSMDKLIDLKEWLDFMNNHKKSWLSDISPIQKNSRAYQYLTLDRNLYNHKFIYQGIYRKWKGDKCYWQSPVIINLNVSNDKLLGIQLRNLEKDRNKRFYKIIEFDEIYNFIHPQNPIDDIESITYNKLSHFYNILNVDFDDYVTIFEGFLDSLFYPNSIGMVGANNDEDLLKFLISADEDLKLRFFYDNDQDGNRKANKMLDRGYSVFLWKKLFNDIIDKSTNKYLMEKKLEKIIDLNDLVLFYNDNKIYDKLNLKEYFSIDLFDKMYLDSVKKIF